MGRDVSEFSNAPRILIDIDGTDISFACTDSAEPLRLKNIRKYRTADFPTATDCIIGFARDADIPLAGSKCVMVVSGAVHGDSVRIARCPWIISISGFRYLFQTVPFVLNDCAAQLWAATCVKPQTHRSLGAHGLPDFSKSGNWLAVNYSDGLGAAILVNDGKGGFVHADSEIGHCAFAPIDDAERQLHVNLSSVKFPVSWEAALTADNSTKSWEGTPIFNHSPNLKRKRCEMLGSFVGDAVLAAAAWNGVFLFKYASELMSQSENYAIFVKRMTARANFPLQLRRVPVWSVVLANSNLAGAAIYLDRKLGEISEH